MFCFHLASPHFPIASQGDRTATSSTLILRRKSSLLFFQFLRGRIVIRTHHIYTNLCYSSILYWAYLALVAMSPIRVRSSKVNGVCVSFVVPAAGPAPAGAGELPQGVQRPLLLPYPTGGAETPGLRVLDASPWQALVLRGPPGLLGAHIPRPRNASGGLWFFIFRRGREGGRGGRGCCLFPAIIKKTSQNALYRKRSCIFFYWTYSSPSFYFIGPIRTCLFSFMRTRRADRAS